MLTPGAMARADSGMVKVIVPAGSAARLAGGGRLIADRDSYLVYEIPQGSKKNLSRVKGLQPRPDFDFIFLNRETIDTRQAPPDVPARMAGFEEGKRLMLLQFAAPPVDRDFAGLRQAGIRIVHYIPQNAYIVWADDDNTARLTALRKGEMSIRFFNNYHPFYALSPRLDDALDNPEPVLVTVQLYNYGPAARAAAEELAADAERIITPPREALRGRYINVRLEIPGSALLSIARLPGVVSVAPYLPPQLFGERQDQVVAGNLNVAETQPSGPGYLSWLSGLGFPTDASSYPVVDIVDDGFDNGNAGSPANSEFREFNSGANPSRVQYAQIAPGASGISSPNGVAGHGNINCSIVGGYNNGTGSPANEDAQGFNYGLGVSPYGRIASTKIFTDGGEWGYHNESNMVNFQYQAGVRITSNSWGASVNGDYDADAQNYDGWTRDARGGTSGNQELLFIFAAGNDGASAGSMGSPATAKNVITVGASEGYSQFGMDGCGTGNSEADNIQDIVSFSSRGPCDDSRTKPEIVAPGSHIHGAASYDPAYDGTGVCDKYNPAGQTKYAESSGTSHSTPGIAGCVSLIYNFLNRIYSVSNPSPALLKAYTIHAGRHMTGSGANDNFPSNNQGFGLINLGFAFDQSAARIFVDQTELLQNSGDTYQVSFTIDNSSEPFRVALAWTDEPGPTSGNAYVNDLDLEVEVNGTTYRGNNFTLGISRSGGAADPRNNTECVFLPAGTTGSVTVTVRGTSITGDGVPGNGDATDQDFALVIYNASTMPMPTTTPTAFGYKTPSPIPATPTPTPSPFGYKTPVPTPTPAAITTPTPLGPAGLFSEDFEGAWSGGVPDNWSKTYISGTTDWIKGIGCDDVTGQPPAAHGGTYNALIYSDDYGNMITRLITPRIDFGSHLLNTGLNFWHTQGDWYGDYDRLKVYYKTSAGGSWQLLASYTSPIETWTERTLSLPNPGSDYYICFEGSTNYGWGVCVDDVLVSGDALALPTPAATPARPVVDSGDYDGDGTSEIAVFRRSSGLWAIRGLTRVYFGGASDIPVPGDYRGSNTTDIGIFRAGSGLWAIRGLTRTYFGASSDRPVPGDYNGDGSCDAGIFRDSTGLWEIRGVTRIYFGFTGDSPVPGDHDGDATKEIGIFRASSGLWAIRGISRIYFGTTGDETVPGDYDGNGTWGVGIFRPSTGLWAVRGVTRAYFGSNSDQPVPADYDGNSEDDVGIFRAGSGLWAVRGVTRVYFGTSGDIPVTR